MNYWVFYAPKKKQLIVTASPRKRSARPIGTVSVDQVELAITRDLTRRVMNRFAASFDMTTARRRRFVRSVVSPEAVEGEILKLVYVDYSKEALIARELAIRIASTAADLQVKKVTVDTTGTSPRAAQAIRLELMQILGIEPEGSCTFLFRRVADAHLYLRSIIALLLSAIIVALALARTVLRRERRSPSAVTPNVKHLYIVYPGYNNHTRQVWKHICNQRSSEKVNVLELIQGLNTAQMRVPNVADPDRVNLVRPWQARDFLPCIVAFAAYWPTFIELIQRAEADLHARVGLLELAVSGARLLRGLMYAKWISRLHLSNPAIALLGLATRADAISTDIALQRKGALTVHWLHGIVGNAVAYLGYSSVCLCHNEIDAEVEREFGRYGVCLSPADLTQGHVTAPQPRGNEEGILLLTNLLHPHQTISKDRAEESISSLLLMISSVSKRIGITRLAWRPHPAEDTESDAFERLRSLASDLSISLAIQDDLPSQLGSYKYIVTTFSTAIADAVQAGHTPAVYSGLVLEDIGHWPTIPEPLKFDSEAQLYNILLKLEDSAFNEQMSAALRKQFCIGSSSHIPLDEIITLANEASTHALNRDSSVRGQAAITL